MKKNKIVVIGAGISGLTTAYWLNKEGFEVTILEAADKPGGTVLTESSNGYLMDFGPNSGLETTPLIRQIAEELEILDQMVYANKVGDKRYILRDNKLHALPTSGPAFFKTDLFSAKAKLRLLAEPFIGKSEDGYYQSIAEFVRRRLGQEFLDYAINPFVAGVFAGDPKNLSVKSAFPKLYRLEEVYGGLIKGMIKGAKERKRSKEKSKQNAKMFSFKDGMQTFPKTIAEFFASDIKYNTEVSKVQKNDNNYVVHFSQNEKEITIESDMVLSTIPAFKADQVFYNIDPKLTETLQKIYYPPVKVMYLGYKKENIGHPLDGFGFLIPEKERKKFLGAIWSSNLFENRAVENYASFTLFVGGSRSPELFENDQDELREEVLKEFSDIMEIKGEPEFIKEKMWPKAIPQYELGYIEYENTFERFELENPGLFLSGNYRGGISVGDCIKNSELTAKRIIEYRNKNWSENG